MLGSLRARVAGDGRKTEKPTGGPTAFLQAELMRFEGRFTARLVTAFAPLVESDDSKVRLRAAEDELRFLSSALDIAASAHPEVNLVDMVALVALGRDAMTQRWDVATYGDESRALDRSFERSLDDISVLARSVVSDDIDAEVRNLIKQWRAENPDLLQVEAVRLSTYVAERAAALAKRAPSVLKLLNQAAHTADDAVLLGERALYAAQRLPFLARKQARVGSGELFADLARNLQSVELPLTAEDARLVLDALVKLRDAVGRRSDAVGQVRSLGRGLEHSLNRLLFKTLLTCSGIVVVTAAVWLVAQVARRRLSTRW